MAIPKRVVQSNFGKVALHLLTQNQQCVKVVPFRHSLLCMYRHSELRCAIGAIIPDEKYKPEMEGKSWRQIVKIEPSLKELLPDSLARALQHVHDCVPIKQWPIQLKHLATSFKLEWRF